MKNEPDRVKDVFKRVEPSERKANKRRIMAVALACFDEFGIEAATVEQIRDLAGSSTGSVYHHFRNKEGLITSLYFAALDDQLALTQPRVEGASTVKDAIHALVQSYLEWVTDQPQLARFLFRARSSVSESEYRDALLQRNEIRYGLLLNRLAEGVKAGTIRELPREMYASLLIGQADNYCRSWVFGRVKARPLDYVDIFAEAAWRSVCV
jgi:AcrR family transcriptional regulator